MQRRRSFVAQTLFRMRRLRHSLSKVLREYWYRLVRSPADEVLWTLWNRGYLKSDRLLSRRNVLSHLSGAALLHVPPDHLEYFVDFDCNRSKRRFVWEGEWEARAVPIRSHHRYRLMQDALHYREDLRQSPSFQELLRRSHTGKPRAIVNKGLLLESSDQIEAFLKQQIALLDSIAKQGIRSELAVDEINVAVGRDGTLYKVNAGRKRTMAAKLLGLNVIPVRVTHVHPLWLARHTTEGQPLKSHMFVRALDAARELHSCCSVSPDIKDRNEE